MVIQILARNVYNEQPLYETTVNPNFGHEILNDNNRRLLYLDVC